MAEYFVVYLDGAGEELDRLAKGPDAKTIAAMEAALLLGYTMTEAKVHVITGVLKASGRMRRLIDDLMVLLLRANNSIPTTVGGGGM